MILGFGNTCIYCQGKNIRKSITNNYLNCLCVSCGKEHSFKLLPIRKNIIYLDQNFFSSAYKGKVKEFLKRYNRLNDLSNKQLIICPYSEAHDKETHLSKEYKKLWEFIRKISRNKLFYCRSKIIDQQLINAYISFMQKGPDKSVLNLSDAISPDVHNWDESLRIEVVWSVTNLIKPPSLREDKKNLVESIIQILPQWRNSKSSFEQDFYLEIRDHAILLLNSLLIQKDLIKTLENEKNKIMHILLDLTKNGNSFEERVKNITDFLVSEYFKNIPNINISAGLWAILKRQIKLNQFLTEKTKQENLKKQIQGIALDIEHLSVFAPYCDAIFTEKRMARLLKEWKQHPLGGYKFKVFSTKNWDAFDAYLDEIENNLSSEMKDELEMVYGIQEKSKLISRHEILR